MDSIVDSVKKQTNTKKALTRETVAPTLKIDKLSIHYGEHVALHEATLLAYPNEILALVGPSGCGKSSLLAAINRMTDTIKTCTVKGEVLFNDENIFAQDYALQSLRKKIGMVFQQANPFPLSIKDNICFPLKDHGMQSLVEREDRMQHVLEVTGLWQEVKGRLNESALRLSGGQQQRLCIARALALEPQLLLLDEPCSALDPISTERIEDLLQELKKSITMVMVTHNLAQARRVADQVAVCWVDSGCGCIVECDETETIFANPSHPVTVAYCGGKAG